MIKPERLKKGDTIGVISPSSPSDREDVDRLEQELISQGFKVKMGKSPYERNKYLAGTDELRAEDINGMFADREVDAILCVRGGYGSPRLLDRLDYDLIGRNPKIFMGFSDITALHIGFTQISNMVTYHGPMGTVDIKDGLDEFSRASLIDVLMSGQEGIILENPKDVDLQVIVDGLGEGEIIGGNLSLIADTMGTPYEIETRGKLLFIEEISEKPRNIDRMLNELRLAGKFEDACGIILGDFNDCDIDDQNSFSLMEVLEGYFKDLDIPVVYDFKSGHCQPMITIPFGVRARLDTAKKQVVLLESATK